MTESLASFQKRVKDATGLELSEIPEGTVEDILGSHIFAKRGDVTVVAVGYPDREGPDGEDIWDPTPENFRVIGFKGPIPRKKYTWDVLKCSDESVLPLIPGRGFYLEAGHRAEGRKTGEPGGFVVFGPAIIRRLNRDTLEVLGIVVPLTAENHVDEGKALI